MNYIELQEKYKKARKLLDKAIAEIKKKCARELLGEVENDPWGIPYRVVMTKIKGRRTQQPTCRKQLTQIVTTLFPKDDTYDYAIAEDEEQDIPDITLEELNRAKKKMRNKKAPGPDNIPNKALKVAIKVAPGMFLDMYNACLREGVFPSRWKQQRLVLLPKGNKPPEEPSSYRPLCMLDAAGKVLERILHDRIEGAVGDKLAKNQFGFRRGRSTVDAIGQVVDIAREAISGKRWRRGTKKYCLLATLDVKNAFNSVSWKSICTALDRLEVPTYLKKMLKSYLSNRVLKYDTDEGIMSYEVTAGVPQGSVLGPLLWILLYDELLNLKLPDDTQVVAYADDAAVIIPSKTIEEIKINFEETFNTIQDWMQEKGLKLAEQKTEAILITSRKKEEMVELVAGRHIIKSQRRLKYLGMMIDNRLNFKDQIEDAAEKASTVAMALSRLMPNTAGPRQIRRRLLCTVITSVLTYGITVWGISLDKDSYRKKIAAPYRRGALRVAAAYRTVSENAALVIAGMKPLELLAQERKMLYERKAQPPCARKRLEAAAKEELWEQWQIKWDAAKNGRWTRRLIPKLKEWTNRKHGEVNYYLTQLLSGHGCYRKYLHRFKYEETPECPGDCRKEEDAEHVFFECPRFKLERQELARAMGRTPEPGNLVKFMLEKKEQWDVVDTFATAVLKKLRKEERARAAAKAAASDSI